MDEAKKQELMKKAFDLAYEYEQKYGDCPQCVLAAVKETLGGISEETFKASHGLAGGGALTTRGSCGALIGAVLAIGSYFGRPLDKFDQGLYMENFKLSKVITDHFDKEWGGHRCEQVQAKIMGRSFDMWDAKDYQAFEDAGGHKDKCTEVAGKAASWAVEVILNEQAKAAK